MVRPLLSAFTAVGRNRRRIGIALARMLIDICNPAGVRCTPAAWPARTVARRVHAAIESRKSFDRLVTRSRVSAGDCAILSPIVGLPCVYVLAASLGSGDRWKSRHWPGDWSTADQRWSLSDGDPSWICGLSWPFRCCLRCHRSRVGRLCLAAAEREHGPVGLALHQRSGHPRGRWAGDGASVTGLLEGPTVMATGIITDASISSMLHAWHNSKRRVAVISWRLAHERLSVAGQIVGAARRAIGVTLARI
jgi:hypothetical protein